MYKKVVQSMEFLGIGYIFILKLFSVENINEKSFFKNKQIGYQSCGLLRETSILILPCFLRIKILTKGI